MKLRHKSQLLIIISSLLVVAVFAATSIISYHRYSLNALQRQAQMGAEMIRLTVTHEMTEGQAGHKDPYIKNLKHIPGLVGGVVVPAQSVIDQYGIDMAVRAQVSEMEKKYLLRAKSSTR